MLDEPRELQVDKAIACINFAQGEVGPVVPVLESGAPVERERLFDCEHFRLWRLRGDLPFAVGASGVARVLVCIEGAGHIEDGGTSYAVGRGDVFLLPAVIGACAFNPSSAVTLLEIALPD
jgi:mannose-6-phosphate isomerase